MQQVETQTAKLPTINENQTTKQVERQNQSRQLNELGEFTPNLANSSKSL